MKRLLYVVLLFVFVVTGCKDKIDEPEMKEEALPSEEWEEEAVHAEGESLEIELINEDDVGVGIATLTESEEGVVIELDAHHLQPGLHGFHIHEKGVCEAPTFESAGGHFNPTNKKHGFDHAEGPHAGDLENIEVKEDGIVQVTVVNDRVTLKEGVSHSLRSEAGTSLVIHEAKDDYVSQPAGEAGRRIVCGVISPPKEIKDKS